MHNYNGCLRCIRQGPDLKSPRPYSHTQQLGDGLIVAQHCGLEAQDAVTHL